MSLVKSEQQLGVDPVQETTLQLQILGELGNLNKSVTKIEHSQQLMSVALLGGIDGDTKHGRLPIVEAAVDDLRKRTEVLEADKIRWNTAVRTASIIAGCVGAAMGTLATLFVNFITRH